MDKKLLEVISESVAKYHLSCYCEELDYKELNHFLSTPLCNCIPDGYLADNEDWHPKIDWNVLEKMKLIRVATRNTNVLHYADLKSRDYKVKDVYNLLKVDYTKFDLFNFDIENLSHEDAYALLCLGKQVFREKINISKYNFSFLEMRDIIRSFDYEREIILDLNYKELKSYQVAEILSMTGEDNLDLFDLDILTTLDWLDLLNYQPGFIKYCDFEKFKKGDTYNLIQLVILFIEPDLTYLMDDIDLKTISALGWEKLLIARPDKFLDKCDFSKLNNSNWKEIISHNPDLAAYKL